jgi:predicted small secreted protein
MASIKYGGIVTSERMNKYIFLTLMTAIFLLAAGSGCRTAHGFGEDMQNAGEKIQEKSDK